MLVIKAKGVAWFEKNFLAQVSSRDHRGAARHAGADLRVSGREPHQ